MILKGSPSLSIHMSILVHGVLDSHEVTYRVTSTSLDCRQMPHPPDALSLIIFVVALLGVPLYRRVLPIGVLPEWPPAPKAKA